MPSRMMEFSCKCCDHKFEASAPEDGAFVQCPECGHYSEDTHLAGEHRRSPAAATDIVAGGRIGGFLVEAKIGVGAMGQVYRARQMSLSRTVALKVLPRAFADRPAFVRRFHEESTALSTLNHPNIVSIIERGHVGRTYFFVMEYVDGPALTKVMLRPVSMSMFMRVVKGVASALEYAHSRGIVHRDIKPSNIMLTSHDVVKVGDFGLASLLTDSAADASESAIGRMGTLSYMSPEQLKAPNDVDGRTDIYALGIIMYQLLTQQHPELPLAQMPSQVCATADLRLDPIIAKCLEERRDARYASATELLADLRRLEMEARLAPSCPQCDRVSPVDAQVCVYCDADIGEFFDECPDCKRLNRMELKQCLYCGSDLARGRTIVSKRISTMLDYADRLRLDGSYAEALHMLDEIRAIGGKAFEEQRSRAAAMRRSALVERRAKARTSFEDANRMLRAHRFAEAIECLRAVPPEEKDVTEAIEHAQQLQADYAVRRKSRAATNLVLFILGLIIVLVIVLIAWAA
jgi:serine/threonine protein kinase